MYICNGLLIPIQYTENNINKRLRHMATKKKAASKKAASKKAAAKKARVVKADRGGK